MTKKVVYIAEEKIEVGVHDIRADLNDEGIAALGSSISRVGVLVPLLVARKGDVFVVIAGHRRLHAARLAGLHELPCIEVKAGDTVNRECSIAENLFRKDLSPMEEAAAIKDWLATGTVELSYIAEAMRRSVAWVEGRLQLLDWPADLQAAVHDAGLSVAAARNLAQISEDAYRSRLVIMAVENGATARTTAAWLQAWRAARPLEVAASAEPVPGRSVTASVVPYSPCVVCETQLRTDSMPFMPICQDCLLTVQELGKRLREPG